MLPFTSIPSTIQVHYTIHCPSTIQVHYTVLYTIYCPPTIQVLYIHCMYLYAYECIFIISNLRMCTCICSSIFPLSPQLGAATLSRKSPAFQSPPTTATAGSPVSGGNSLLDTSLDAGKTTQQRVRHLYSPPSTVECLFYISDNLRALCEMFVVCVQCCVVVLCIRSAQTERQIQLFQPTRYS